MMEEIDYLSFKLDNFFQALKYYNWRFASWKSQQRNFYPRDKNATTGHPSSTPML